MVAKYCSYLEVKSVIKFVNKLLKYLPLSVTSWYSPLQSQEITTEIKLVQDLNF